MTGERFSINDSDDAQLQFQIAEYGINISNEDVVKKLNNYESSRLKWQKEKRKYRRREDKYQRVIGGIMAYLELLINDDLWWEWNED